MNEYICFKYKLYNFFLNLKIVPQINCTVMSKNVHHMMLVTKLEGGGD